MSQASLAVVLIIATLPTARCAEVRHDYCIIGAGPGGLQVGHLMLQRGWDFVTLERHTHSGSFFER